jgi:hypothetical protein
VNETCRLCGVTAEVDLDEVGPVCRSCEAAVRGNLIGALSADFLAMKKRLWARYESINTRYGETP